jgi:hypothetical protein
MRQDVEQRLMTRAASVEALFPLGALSADRGRFPMMRMAF